MNEISNRALLSAEHSQVDSDHSSPDCIRDYFLDRKSMGVHISLLLHSSDSKSSTVQYSTRQLVK